MFAYRKNASNDTKQYDKIVLYLVGKQAASNGTLWFYGRRGNDPTYNWNITNRLGRYMIRGDAGPEYKIDKRQQIATLARHWAGIWPQLKYPYQTISYPSPPVRGTRNLFTACDGFVGYINGRLGFSYSSTTLGSGPLRDSGVGAFRSFRARAGSAYSKNFIHVSIVVGGGEIVDNNNTGDSTGPKKRFDYFGTGPLEGGAFWGGSNSENRSFTDPVILTKTQLQVLDQE